MPHRQNGTEGHSEPRTAATFRTAQIVFTLEASHDQPFRPKRIASALQIPLGSSVPPADTVRWAADNRGWAPPRRLQACNQREGAGSCRNATEMSRILPWGGGSRFSS